MNKHSPLTSVLNDVDTARGLPNEHYIDPAVFAEEKLSVLFANWAGIGFAKDVPEVGDANPIDFMGMPLLVVRDRDGTIGRVTSGAYGYTVGMSLALGYVKGAQAGDRVEVMVLGQRHKAVILDKPPFDADGAILRG